VESVGFAVVLALAVSLMPSSFAQAPEPSSGALEQPGSVIVFPEFIRGTVIVDGAIRARNEIEVRARCPNGAVCAENEPLRVRFHWVCPGREDITSKNVCTESDFDVVLPVNGKASFNPEDPNLMENGVGSIAPCPTGYLIGWAISPATQRPIKYDGLTGSAVLRNGTGTVGSYEAFTITADRNLSTGAEIATDIDPRTGSPALVFDGAAGHYQSVGATVPAALQYHKLIGPLSSGEAFLILLTLDVRANRPNYPTIIDLELRSDQGGRISIARNFICWTEIRNPNIDGQYTLTGARIRDGIVISGQAVKVPFVGISDIPGPVTLLGLVPAATGGPWSMDQAYVVKRFDGIDPKTVFVPF
jgi:hypothetical protein